MPVNRNQLHPDSAKIKPKATEPVDELENFFKVLDLEDELALAHRRDVAKDAEIKALKDADNVTDSRIKVLEEMKELDRKRINELITERENDRQALKEAKGKLAEIAGIVAKSTAGFTGDGRSCL